MTTPNKDTTAPTLSVECDDCGRLWPKGEFPGDLGSIENLFDRIDPGQEVPAGECPECGALCYLQDEAATPEPPTRLFHSPLPWFFNDGISKGSAWYMQDKTGTEICQFDNDEPTAAKDGKYIEYCCNNFPSLAAEKLALQTQVNTLRAALSDIQKLGGITAETAIAARALAATEHHAPPAVTVAARVLNAAKEAAEWLDLLKQNYPDMHGLIRAIEELKKGTQCAA